MHASTSPSSTRSGRPAASLLCLILTVAAGNGCSDDNDHSAAPPVKPPPTRTELQPHEELPGLVLAITGVSGATGPSGSFRSGDVLSVTFTLQKGDGAEIAIGELNSAGILVSGPTTSYQRVLARQTDVVTRSVLNADGSYTYTFAAAIPSAYLPPLNDSTSFGAADGELQGQSLLPGTYTVGIEVYKTYTVLEDSFRDPAGATRDFLLGGATTPEPREVVKPENCNQCHVEIRAHGEFRRDVGICVLCHTAGAEDRNVATVEGGTPGVSIEFGVMIHRIHNAAHLPSVLGVATNTDGTRNYAATPKPYKMIGNQDRVIDFSEIAFPVWPNLNIALPRDHGYTALTGPQRSAEDAIRTGATDCAKCHGDPDGGGALPAPADGDLAYLEPSMAACGSCHDDIDWTLPYEANGQRMEVSDYAIACNTCHPAQSTPFMDPIDPLAVRDAHLHPMLQTTDAVGPATPFNPGLHFVVSDVTRVGAGDGSPAFQVDDRVAVTFTLEHDDGTPVDPADLATSISVVVAGPNHNSNLLMYTNFDKAAITGSPPYTLELPEAVWLEDVGVGGGTAGEGFGTLRTPHWHDVGSVTSVRLVTGSVAGTTTLSAAAPARQNFLDVGSALAIVDGDTVVIDEGQPEEEYMRVQRVDGTRLWFASRYQSDFPPSLRNAHDAGASVQEVTVATLATPADFTVDPAGGEVTEVGNAFGTGQPILVTYTTDFLVPAVYEGALNDSPDLDETWADWSGKPLVDGTYRLAMWSRLNLSWVVDGDPYGLPDEATAYRAVSEGVATDFLYGTATEVESYDLISSAQNCYDCHNDMYFHGNGRRGVETCLICHSTAGSEDHPQYRTPGAPETTGVTVNFRGMLHKIHMGAELTNASSYVVAGNGGSQHMYDEVHFPAWPDGTKNCTACHGTDNDAWTAVADRDHPTDQVLPAREWRAVCTTCHDDDLTAAHVEAQTSGGVETCVLCHGEGADFAVEVMHKPR
jgi:hypothetical protein